DAGGPRLAAAALAEHTAHSGHIVSRASAREHGGGGPAGAVRSSHEARLDRPRLTKTRWITRRPQGPFFHASRRTWRLPASGAHRTWPAVVADWDARRCLSIPAPSANQPNHARQCRR